MLNTGQHLKTILSQSHGDLARILQGFNQLQALNSLLQDYLPDNIKVHCRAVFFDQGKLIIEAANSSWAAKLRFALPELLSHLRRSPGYAHIKSIEHRVAKAQGLPPSQRKSEPSGFSLSRSNEAVLKACIANLKEGKLKQALEKFLNHYAIS